MKYVYYFRPEQESVTQGVLVATSSFLLEAFSPFWNDLPNPRVKDCYVSQLAEQHPFEAETNECII